MISFIHNPEIRKAVKRIRYAAYTLVALMSLVLSLVMPAGVARAATVYDDAYQTVDSLTLSQTWPEGCSTADVTFSWAQYLINPTYRYLTDSTSVAQYNAQATSFAAARDHGVWAVSKHASAWSGGNYIEALHIVWSEDPNATLTWATSPYQLVNLTKASGSSYYIHDADIGRRAGWGTAGGAPCDLVWGNPGGVSTSVEISNEYGDRNDVTTAAAQANMFVSMDNPTHPGGLDYEGESIRTVPPSAHYVALGDSFSSGEGNEPFEYGTANDGVNECHRNSEAYPRLLAGNSSLSLGSTAFVACSGATTQNVLHGGSADGAWHEAPQVDALSEDTDVVTITIGGNDVGFPAFATECLYPFSLTRGVCDEFTDIYDETISKINNDLGDDLVDLYGELLEDAPNAQIYIGGYPQISPYKDVEDAFDQDCGELYGEFPNNWGDARAAHEVVTQLNNVIEGSVTSVNTEKSTSRLHFVDVEGGAFSEHDVCSSSSDFNGVDLFNTEYSVHPNADGHIAYSEDFADAID